ncbi:ubiquitin-like-specific protease 1 [Acyrthosiphon pisum]|uniref:Ubiquitin-like protease family profile domain-containing protein n=1 Tax=Acyrthosiphon pisum TaxID=7029 RepID=A0A8R1W6Z1_ACYPI|nr:ubiquitin-like-specific protease 1 [Acyrthosiphon pisum]XP_016656100.1 ubiquitin-like-specific protease 1 [Acyrthosiphon pisum]|eukprot:XP_003241301.1 PREDICTED: ubiquitin-like-specific protease 1 [Acyrthosiphon pisum]
MMDFTEDNEEYYYSIIEDINEPHCSNNINASLQQMEVVDINPTTIIQDKDTHAISKDNSSEINQLEITTGIDNKNSTQENTSTIDLCSSDDEDMNIGQLTYNPVVKLDTIKLVKRPKNVKKILPKHRKKTEKTINFLTGQRENDVVNSNIKLNGYDLRMRDIITLLTPKSWLNDVIILNYISLLVRNCEDTLIISTDTWVDFGRRKHETVKRWAKKNNLYDYKKIVIPINPNKNHWALFVVDIWEGVIHSFDSFNKTHIKEYNIVSEFLILAYNYSIKKPGEERTMPNWKYQIENSPQQKNTYDCGIFTCTNARYFLFAKKLEFTQPDCQLLRKRIAYELIHNELIQDQSTNL